MKALYKYSMIALLGIGMFTSCSEDLLETTPTTAVATGEMTNNAGQAIAALDGIYRLTYTTGYTSGWEHEESGLTAFTLVADCMGEDFVITKSGSGWYWYDYLLDVKGDYTHNAGRPYGTWKFFYNLIANANYLCAAETTMEGSKEDVNYIVGQAFAIRAFSYFMLSQWFARTYKGHEDELCVPIYNEPTDKNTKGKARATVAQVYAQIDADIQKAESLLESSGKERLSKSHLGIAEVYGIHARIAQVEENWTLAKQMSEKAIAAAKAEGLSILPVNQFAGNNKLAAANVMWGVSIVSDQAQMYASFLTQMDYDMGKYGATSPKLINSDLYAMMGKNDARRDWWEDPKDPSKQKNGIPYLQEKFKFTNYKTWEGDYIYMRIEEMYLIKAEAECMLGDDAAAQATLNALIQTRDADYNCTKTGTELNTVAQDRPTGSLREEITNQRRIELWGEFGRIYDLRRLHQGYKRSTDQGHPSSAARVSDTEDPESFAWVLVIPQSEFDGNENMDSSKDQNPF